MINLLKKLRHAKFTDKLAVAGYVLLLIFIPAWRYYTRSGTKLDVTYPDNPGMSEYYDHIKASSSPQDTPPPPSPPVATSPGPYVVASNPKPVLPPPAVAPAIVSVENTQSPISHEDQPGNDEAENSDNNSEHNDDGAHNDSEDNHDDVEDQVHDNSPVEKPEI